MRNKHRLLVDASSILRAMHFAGKDVENGRFVTFNDKKVWVNSAQWGYDNFMTSYQNLLKMTGLKPFQTILVKDGVGSRTIRQALYPQYKAHRPEQAPELNQEYFELLYGVEDEILAMGGTVAVQDNREADDVIAYLATNLEGRKTVWTRDGDMLALRSELVDVYLKDKMNPETYDLCPAEYVLLYKALVGDSSDNLPGAKGFGPKAFAALVINYGYEGCDVLLDLLETRRLDRLVEDVAEFKPLQKILDNQDAVYSSYACAKFYINRINTCREPLQLKAGKVEQWDPSCRHYLMREYFGTKTLLTADNFEQQFSLIVERLQQSPYTALDIETSVTDEGEAWCAAIDAAKTNRKSDTIDVLGALLTGLSITFGDNTQHTIYCSVDHADTNNCSLGQAKALLDALPPDTPVAIHNANFELPVLHETYQGYWVPNVWDTVDMKSHVDENTNHKLKDTAKLILGYEQQTYEEVTCTHGKVGTIDDCGRLKKTYKNVLAEGVYEEYIDPKTGKTRKKTISKPVTEMWETRSKRMNELPATHVFDYGCDDTIVTAALFNYFLIIMELEQTIHSFRDCDLEASYWVAQAFVDGVPCDFDHMKEIEKEDDKIFNAAWAELREYLFDINWPGCAYVPFTEIVPATVKQAFQATMGVPFDCMARLPEKIAAALQKQGAPELAEYVLSGDLDGFNEYVSGFFIAEPDFDVNKTEHLRTLLYDQLKVPVRFRTTPTENMRNNGIWEGTPQADFAAVEHALQLDVPKGSREAEVLLRVREMTQVSTRRKLYYKPYPLYAHWKTGRIHSNLGKNRTATRRFAPSGPNVNQLAKKGEGKKIRTCFRAPKGYFVCAMDFSGQELRIAAERSQDEMLLSCYIGDNKRDPHSLTGAGIAAKKGSPYGDYELFEAARFGEDEEAKKIVKEFRDELGKKVNFGSQYLCQAPKLAKLLIVNVGDAQIFLDAKNEVYWGLANWQQDTIAKAHAQGFVTTLLGARRHLHEKLCSVDKWSVLEAERQGVNYEIQGSGAEMTKRAINPMPRVFKKEGGSFWFPVHDEAVFLLPIDNGVACIQALHACMVQPYGGMTVPLESEISIGPSFGELTKVGTVPDANRILEVLTSVFGEEALAA